MRVKSIAKKAFYDTIPVLTGYIVLGIGFGILLKTNGFGLLWSLAMSIFIFAGSMQYAGIALMATGASFLTVALTTFMVNCRHFFYGISMVNKYKEAGKFRPYLMFALTDETYSLVCEDIEGIDEKKLPWYYFFVSIFDQSYWVLGSVIGSVLGAIIPFSTEGIDFSLTALFIVVFTDQWLHTKNHFAALVGLISTILMRVIFGADNFLIPSMILIAFALVSGRKFSGQDEVAKSEENESVKEEA